MIVSNWSGLALLFYTSFWHTKRSEIACNQRLNGLQTFVSNRFYYNICNFLLLDIFWDILWDEFEGQKVLFEHVSQVKSFFYNSSYNKHQTAKQSTKGFSATTKYEYLKSLKEEHIFNIFFKCCHLSSMHLSSVKKSSISYGNGLLSFWRTSCTCMLTEELWLDPDEIEIQKLIIIFILDFTFIKRKGKSGMPDGYVSIWIF